MRKTTTQTKANPRFRFRDGLRDLPATQGMLQLVRTELKSEMKSGFRQVGSRLEQVLSEVARVGILVEEQNSRNRVVLEGLTGLWERQQRSDNRVSDVEKLVRIIGRAKP